MTEESQLQLFSCIASAYVYLTRCCLLATGGFSVLIRKLKESLSFYLAIVSSVD